MLEQSAVTYNTYDGTIKGKFKSNGSTLWAAFAYLVLLRVSKCQRLFAFQSLCFSDCFLVFSWCLWVCICLSVLVVRSYLFCSAFLSARFLFFRSFFIGLAVPRCVLFKVRSNQPTGFKPCWKYVLIVEFVLLIDLFLQLIL